MNEEVRTQHDYYANTADTYDEQHAGDVEHDIALSWLCGLIRYYGADSILDVGAGTGRVIRRLAEEPGLEVDVTGIEPVAELRRRGHATGISPEMLINGDANRLDIEDGSFDFVSAFALLHHVRDPTQVVAEMIRVARKGVFISDSNCFGAGRPAIRFLKQVLNAAGLWKAAQFVQTRGRMYKYDDMDGVFYTYSVFNNIPQLRRNCGEVYTQNTRSGGSNIYRSCSHVAVFGLR